MNQRTLYLFLDVNIKRHNSNFIPSVYRKPSFSGLGTSYFRSCCKVFKMNGIRTLLHRAFNVCSSATILRNEISFLKNFFVSNGFPIQLVEFHVEKFFSKILDPPYTVHSVPRKRIFFPMMFFGHKSEIMKAELNKLISEYFYHIDPQIILINKFKIGSLFKCKENSPKNLCSSIIYKYCCPRNCGSEYVGSTVRTLFTRAMEHRGISNRTGRPLQAPVQSSPRNHSETCSSDISLQDFSIIGGAKYITDLHILESLKIFKLKPNLNGMESAHPLLVVNH